MEPWYKRCFSRLLVDNHITEDDPSFMTRFDPERYVAMARKAGVDSAMVYSCGHNGNCYYPTKVGHMHANLNGRDIFGEVVAGMRAAGIVPIAYYTAVYHNHSARTHPQWRTVSSAGGRQHNGRYWYSCPNNDEYVEFTKQQIAEVIAYDVEGIFIDMTFWSCVCVCSACRTKFLAETGREIPTIVNWDDPAWVTFQRARERWLAQYAQRLTGFIRATRDDMTVTHQFSPVLAGWYLGQTPGIANASDYASGDFYGGKPQQRLATKVMAAFANMPFEFHTSRCVDLRDHTSMKSEAEMVCSAATTLAAGGAYEFIDAINPDGTLEQHVYDRLSRVTARLKPFREMMKTFQPRVVADVGLYFSMASHVKPADNGLSVTQLLERANNMEQRVGIPTVRELIGTTMALNRANIPHRVVTSQDADLSGLKAIVVNNAAYMSADEAERLREFVRGGGTLIATGRTSLHDVEGHTTGEFALADVFGVSYAGEQSMRVSFLSDDEQGFILADSPAPLVKATTARSLAKVAEPTFDPDDEGRWASIHSDPPGDVGEYDGLTVNRFGEGQCVYLYSDLLGLKHDAQQSFGAHLFGQYAASDILVSTEAPSCVEITILRSAVGEGYLVCFVNYQDELPNIPVPRVSATVRLPDGFVPSTVRAVSDGSQVDCPMADGQVTIEATDLDVVEMFQLR